MSTPRGRRPAQVGLAVALLLLAAQARGVWRSDVLAIAAPSGRVFATGQHRGRVVLAMTDRPLLGAGDVRTAVIVRRAEIIDPLFPAVRPSKARRTASFTTGESMAAWGPGAAATYFRYVAFPTWALIAVALLLPARRAAIVARESRRRGRGHCPDCGYDLRGSPGRCPECGQDDSRMTSQDVEVSRATKPGS